MSAAARAFPAHEPRKRQGVRLIEGLSERKLAIVGESCEGKGDPPPVLQADSYVGYTDPKSGRRARSDRGGRFKAARLEYIRAHETIDAQSKEAVLSAIQAHRDEIRAVGVRRLGLFGSFARNEQTAESDVDLLVEFDPGQKTFDNFMKLTLLIEDLCERRVDLVTREALSPYLRPHVMTEIEYANLDSIVERDRGQCRRDTSELP